MVFKAWILFLEDLKVPMDGLIQKPKEVQNSELQIYITMNKEDQALKLFGHLMKHAKIPT